MRIVCSCKVTESEAREWCYLNRDALYFETSAVEENSVEVVLLQIARCAIGYAPHAPAPLFNLQDVVLENGKLLNYVLSYVCSECFVGIKLSFLCRFESFECSVLFIP